MKSNTSLTTFKAVAAIASIYHIILGLIGTFGSPSFIGSAVERVYGVAPVLNSQFIAASRFAGSYILAFGIMMAFLSREPKKYNVLVVPAVIMFATRIFDRLIYFGTLQDAFDMTMAQNMVTVIPVAIMTVLLLVLRPKE